MPQILENCFETISHSCLANLFLELFNAAYLDESRPLCLRFTESVPDICRNQKLEMTGDFIRDLMFRTPSPDEISYETDEAKESAHDQVAARALPIASEIRFQPAVSCSSWLRPNLLKR